MGTRQRWVAVGVGTVVVVAGLVAVLWSRDSDSSIEEHLAVVGRIRAGYAANEFLQGDGRVVGFADALLDGRLDAKEYERFLAMVNSPATIDDASWERLRGKFTTREEAGESFSVGSKVQFNALLAGWFKEGMPTEDGLRSRVIAQLLGEVHDTNPMLARNAFVALNVMGALAEPAVRDQAVAALRQGTDAGVHEFVEAWVQAERVVRSQASPSR